MRWPSKQEWMEVGALIMGLIIYAVLGIIIIGAVVEVVILLEQSL